MIKCIGHQIVDFKSCSFCSQHEKLFGVYITNFSCGPDSFLVTYFRNIMGSKPSLTLELDSHTADAGVDTRVEAFWMLCAVTGIWKILRRIIRCCPVQSL